MSYVVGSMTLDDISVAACVLPFILSSNLPNLNKELLDDTLAIPERGKYISDQSKSPRPRRLTSD